MRKKPMNLSEMFVVSKTYPRKVRWYVRIIHPLKNSSVMPHKDGLPPKIAERLEKNSK